MFSADDVISLVILDAQTGGSYCTSLQSAEIQV